MKVSSSLRLAQLALVIAVAAASSSMPSLTTTDSSSSVSSSTSTESSSITSSSASASPSTSSSSSYTFTATIPTSNVTNPYIARSTEPEGTMFISIGAVIGAILASFFTFTTLSFLCSRMRKSSQTIDLFETNDEKHFTYDPSIFGKMSMANDGASTIFGNDYDTKSNFIKTSAQSVYSMGGESTLGSTFFGAANSSVEEYSVPQQGRSLRNALLNGNNSTAAISTVATKQANRKSRALSMFISPMEEAMQQSQAAIQPPMTTYDMNNSSSIFNSPTPSSFKDSSTINNSDPPSVDVAEDTATKRLTGLDWYNAYEVSQQQEDSAAVSNVSSEVQNIGQKKKKIRPPSLLLDDLMNSFVTDNEDDQNQSK